MKWMVIKEIKREVGRKSVCVREKWFKGSEREEK